MSCISKHTNEDLIPVDFFNKYLPGGILGGVFEPDLPLCFINDCMLSYLRYDDMDDFAYHTKGFLINCVHPDDRKRVIAEISQQFIRKDNEYTSTYRMIRRDGSTLWTLVKGKLVTLENGKQILIKMCIDISEQKELENQLALYRSASRGGAFVLRMEDHFPLVYGNDIFYQVYEYSPKRFSKELNNLNSNLIHPEDVSNVEALIWQAFNSGRGNLIWDMRIITGKGNIRWIQSRGTFEYRDGYPILSGFVVDVTEQYMLSEEVRRSEERFRIAAQEVNISIWEYDIIAHTLFRAQNSHYNSIFPEITYNVPQGLIDLGIIHPDSEKDLFDLYDKIRRGDSRAQADIKFVLSNSALHWERIVFTTVFDDKGNPVRAVAVTEDITHQKEAEINYQRELQLRDNVSVGFIAGARINLTKNRIEFIQVTETSPLDLREGISCDAFEQILCKTMTNLDDRERFIGLFSREALLATFAKGSTVVAMDYRRKGLDGKIAWVNTSVRLMRDVVNADTYAYINMRDINGQKTIELALRHRAEHDAITGAYNKETALDMMQAALITAQEKGISYAILLFNIDNFSELVHVAGYTAVDNAMRELYMLLQAEFSDPKIIGRIYGDEMALFLGNNPDKHIVCETVESICRTMHSSAAFIQPNMSLLISVKSLFSEDDDDSQSDLLDRMRQASTQYNDKVHVEQVRSTDWEVALYDCINMLEKSSDSNKSLIAVLRTIATYYGANRVYILEASDDTKTLAHTYMWSADSPEIKQNDEALFSLLLKRTKIISDNTITPVSEDTELYQLLQSQGSHAVYAVPLEQNKYRMGYMVVSNPTYHIGDIILLNVMQYMLAGELLKRRIWSQHELVRYFDGLTGVLNRKGYMRYLDELLSETLISLGVVSITINGLKRINAQYGHVYGDKLLCFIAQTLKNTYKEAQLFRLSGDEFSVICENLTTETFQETVSTFRALVDGKYPHTISLGFVWSDSDINIESLISQADEQMMISKQAYYKENGALAKHYDPKTEQDLIDDIHAGRYEVYLQPKASTADEIICGAEALIRYRNAEGAIIAPTRFIPQLEQDGNIHHIDLFIFEQVCKILQEWQQKGFAALPISLNFSRSTLLADNLIEQMEKIYHRYEVPKELIEIEITESIGSVERETIIRIGREIVEHNYRLALDDFGAKYSNLAIVSAMKLHTLKLDKSLINDLFSNKNTRILVKSFLQACREMNIRSVAEGVETKEQLETLFCLGCDYAQGYYFNKPIRITEFEHTYMCRSK